MWSTLLFAVVVAADPADGGITSVMSALSGKGPVRVATMSTTGQPLMRGHAAEVEKERLAPLGSPKTCDDRSCFEQAFATCVPARFAAPVTQGHCATEPRQEPVVGWYATRRVPKQGCRVVMFAARGEQVVVDRECRAVPLEYYDLACPDDPEVVRMVEASRKTQPAPKRKPSR